MAADLPGIVRLRDRREAMTLRLILTAARGLFAERGYARTSMRLIAKEAGVVPQTLYAHFGSKAGILAGLVDLLDDEAGIPDLMAEADSLTNPVELLGLLARISRQVRERCGDIITILSSGAAVDPEVAATQSEGQRRNRLGVQIVIDRVRASAPTLQAEAADIAVALMTKGVYDSLVVESGWSHDDYEAWLKRALVTGLLP